MLTAFAQGQELPKGDLARLENRVLNIKSEKLPMFTLKLIRYQLINNFARRFRLRLMEEHLGAADVSLVINHYN